MENNFSFLFNTDKTLSIRIETEDSMQEFILNSDQLKKFTEFINKQDTSEVLNLYDLFDIKFRF